MAIALCACARRAIEPTVLGQMRFGLRKCSAVLFISSIAFFFSCEKHHVGELPPEKPGDGTEHTSPAATVSPTPAEFFPTSTPR
jgi:hypothetical protein